MEPEQPLPLDLVLPDEILSVVASRLPPFSAYAFARACRAGRQTWSHRSGGSNMAEIVQVFSDKFKVTTDCRDVSIDMGHSTGDDLGVFAASVRLGALETCRSLEVDGAGVEGVRVLADAAASGALSGLVELDFEQSDVGDEGVMALTDSAFNGGLPVLETLYLSCDTITDAGLNSLTETVQHGRWPNIRNIAVRDNPASLEARRRLRVACSRRGNRRDPFPASCSTLSGQLDRPLPSLRPFTWPQCVSSVCSPAL